VQEQVSSILLCFFHLFFHSRVCVSVIFLKCTCVFQHASDIADIDSLRDELATARADGRATKAALDAARTAAEAQSAELNRVWRSREL
jgi:hypothetical protein